MTSIALIATSSVSQQKQRAKRIVNKSNNRKSRASEKSKQTMAMIINTTDALPLNGQKF